MTKLQLMCEQYQHMLDRKLVPSWVQQLSNGDVKFGTYWEHGGDIWDWMGSGVNAHVPIKFPQ